jgi:ATP-binding cassette, subfamily F, member 3
MLHCHAMLTLKNLSLRRGPRALFENVNLTLFAGYKVGITGANGSGKSSLLALIRGELHQDAGDFSLPPNLVIAHVAQETPATERIAIDYVMDGDEELRRVEHQLAEAEAANEGTRQATLHARLEVIDAYTARARAARLLRGLGFAPGQEEQKVETFSGGWRMRLNLARALMCRSDLLLLDEPTNHLDLDAVIWLQEWLGVYPGTLLLISHDRDFLDDVADHIAHIEQNGIQLYSGNYSAFEIRRAEQLAGQQAARVRQQREIDHVQSFVTRFRAQATKARQAQSRLKALARMTLIAPAHVDSPFHFEFRQPKKLPAPLLRLTAISAGYADRKILSGVTLGLSPGDRIGLLGPNGAGKSTLVKVLAGTLPILAGERLPAQDLRIGYFAQHQLEQLQTTLSPLEHLRQLDPAAGEKDLRGFLGGFGFTGDMALQPVAPFSGGEKARLVLALLIYQNPNLLLLDEPTNHLDLEMRHALTLALQDYAGALVVVSHDRHLLRSVTDELLLVIDGQAQPFDGDLQDYRAWLLERRSDSALSGGKKEAPHSATARKDQRRLDADRRARLQPLRTELAKLETALDRTSADMTRVETQLADPSLYLEAQKPRLKELLKEQTRLKQSLVATEDAWIALSEQLAVAEQEA